MVFSKFLTNFMLKLFIYSMQYEKVVNYDKRLD